MEMRHLRLVQTLASEGTLTAAGHKLYLSQSALSHQLREIEDELGVRLFTRLKKRMVLTDAGQRVLDGAEVVLGEIDRTRNDVALIATGSTGTLRVGAGRNTSFRWLPTVLKVFRKTYPNVDVTIETTPGNDPTLELVDGSIDVAILNGKHEKPGVIFLRLFDDEMVALVRSDHPWADRDFVSARHFADEHLIGYDVSIQDAVFSQKILTPAGVAPKSVVHLPTTDAIISMVEAGMGTAVLSKWTVSGFLGSPDLSAVRVTRSGFKRSWYAAVTNGERKPPYIGQFIGTLRNHAMS